MNEKVDLKVNLVKKEVLSKKNEEKKSSAHTDCKTKMKKAEN